MKSAMTGPPELAKASLRRASEVSAPPQSCGHELDTQSTKRRRCAAPFRDGASRTRTRDLLGAIHAAPGMLCPSGPGRFCALTTTPSWFGSDVMEARPEYFLEGGPGEHDRSSRRGR